MQTTTKALRAPGIQSGQARMKGFLRRTWPLHLMLLPAVILQLIFGYLPLGGLVIAFKDFKPYDGIWGSAWVGLEHFRFMFEYPDSKQVIINTALIAGLKIMFNIAVPFIFALLLNEVRRSSVKRTVQTLVYLPYFISWVFLGGILTDMLASDGIVNSLLNSWFGIEPILFLGEGNWFRFTVVLSDVWQQFGFGTIVYLAALAGVNPSLYEAAEVDGATRWQQTIHVTIPSLIPIVIVVGTLAMGNILNADFDQIFNLYNPLVYEKGDIIDTFVYRTGILNGQYSFGTAVGIFKSVVGFVLIVIGYRIAYKLADYKIF
ncbi:putative aldouronate transport system permease protein [Paenibacillus phyllosphaerae]|uniref:Putative aldouronate transport system permease protein n=2 Tax=Paenibacillus phyllosphaerae TaxID=274593 RepID=A0A7W5B1J9_9BACL|nr:putative aldouronate transport system permease protein [Paenibacillus phyllosphaerae]